MHQPTNNPGNASPLKEISLRDLTEILVKHYDFHEGFYDVGIQFNVAVGQVGVSPEQTAPGALVSIVGVGISQSPTFGKHSVDASVVNPLKKKRAPRATKK